MRICEAATVPPAAGRGGVVNKKKINWCDRPVVVKGQAMNSFELKCQT